MASSFLYKVVAALIKKKTKKKQLEGWSYPILR